MIDTQMFEWRRLAEPQIDQYDTKVAVFFASAEVSPRTFPRAVPSTRGGGFRFCDGLVSTRYLQSRSPGAPRTCNAPLDHPNLLVAESYLRAWPEAYMQFQQIMHTVHPIDLAAGSAGLVGSISHSDEERFGTMYGSVFDPVGLAEAFVHEMAHNKLRALGITNESANHLILNDAHEEFDSPVHRLGKRPMTAVVHAEFSFVHVAALLLRLLSSVDVQVDYDRVAVGLKKNLTKIERGWATISNCCRTDACGADFLNGLEAWVTRLLQDGGAAVSTSAA